MQTIPKEALTFLKRLRANNNRDWFNARKPQFKALEREMKEFYRGVERLLNQHDEIQHTKAYRIYRDIRFTNDKTPYKKHFAAHFSRQKPELRGGYYLHIEPGNHSFVGGGFWKPNKRDLDRVRKEWEIDAGAIKSVLGDQNFRGHWGEMQGRSLKTAPRGFDRGHPDIELINFKQWVFHHNFTDQEVLAKNFGLTIDEYYRSLRPFFDYMSDILTTDLNGVSLLD